MRSCALFSLTEARILLPSPPKETEPTPRAARGQQQRVTKGREKTVPRAHLRLPPLPPPLRLGALLAAHPRVVGDAAHAQLAQLGVDLRISEGAERGKMHHIRRLSARQYVSAYPRAPGQFRLWTGSTRCRSRPGATSVLKTSQTPPAGFKTMIKNHLKDSMLITLLVGSEVRGGGLVGWAGAPSRPGRPPWAGRRSRCSAG